MDFNFIHFKQGSDLIQFYNVNKLWIRCKVFGLKFYIYYLNIKKTLVRRQICPYSHWFLSDVRDLFREVRCDRSHRPGGKEVGRVGRDHLPPPPPGKQGGGPWAVTKVTTTCKLVCSLVVCSAAHTRASLCKRSRCCSSQLGSATASCSNDRSVIAFTVWCK